MSPSHINGVALSVKLQDGVLDSGKTVRIEVICTCGGGGERGVFGCRARRIRA